MLHCPGGSPGLSRVPFSMEVAEHGKAAAGDLRPGDVIVTINGESAAEMLNVEAQNKIKQSRGQLRLEVERWVGAGGQPGHPALGASGVCARVGVPSHVYVTCFPHRWPLGLCHPRGSPSRLSN